MGDLSGNHVPEINWFSAFFFILSFEKNPFVLILCLVQNAGEKDSNLSLPKNRANSIPAYVGSNSVTKQPIPVASSSGPTSTVSHTNQPGDGSLPSHERLNKLFERLELGDVERLQDISRAVKSFDR